MATQRLKITQAACEKTPPNSKLWDTEIKGFGLFTGKTTKTFYYQREVRGKTVRIKLGKPRNSRYLAHSALDFPPDTSVTDATPGLTPGAPRYQGQHSAGPAHPRIRHANIQNNTPARNQSRNPAQAIGPQERRGYRHPAIGHGLAASFGSGGPQRAQEGRIYH